MSNALEKFSPLVRQMIVDSVVNAADFVNDQTRGDAENIQQFCESLNPYFVIDNAVIFLAQQLDPDSENINIVTPAMMEAIKLVVMDRLSFAVRTGC